MKYKSCGRGGSHVYSLWLGYHRNVTRGVVNVGSPNQPFGERRESHLKMLIYFDGFWGLVAHNWRFGVFFLYKSAENHCVVVCWF